MELLSLLILCAVAPVAIVVAGSHRNLAACVVVAVVVALACVVVTGSLMPSPTDPALGPVLSLLALGVVGLYLRLMWVYTTRPITVGMILEKLTERRRRRATVRATVRQRVKRYRVEVNHG